MSTPIRSIVKSITYTSNNQLDIVSFCNNPHYDYMFSRVGHKFHLYGQWDKDIIEKPQNIFLDTNPDLPLNVDGNIVLCHNRLYQYDISLKLSSFWHMPICSINSTLPRDVKYRAEWPSIKARIGHTNIFFSHGIQESWELPGYVVYPGIEMPDISNQERIHISHLWCSTRERDMVYKTLGPLNFIRNNDFSSTLIFVNSTNQFYPIHLLVAMSFGCCVVTQPIPELSDVLVDGQNVLMYKDIIELKQILNHYKQKKEDCIRVGSQARETVADRFPMDTFIQKMNIVFSNTAEMVYRR